MEARSNSEVSEKKEKVDSLAKKFGLKSADDEEEDSPDIVPIIAKKRVKEGVFYLWDSNMKYVNLFGFLQPYLSEHYEFNMPLLLKLIEKKKLNLEKTISLLPFIRQGYVSTILKSLDDGKQKD